eukprot:3935656-Rhodomonas_salina.1
MTEPTCDKSDRTRVNMDSVSPNDRNRKKARVPLGDINVNLVANNSRDVAAPQSVVAGDASPWTSTTATSPLCAAPPSPGIMPPPDDIPQECNPPPWFTAASGDDVKVGAYVLGNFDCGLYRGIVRAKTETRRGITVKVQFPDDQWETYILPDDDLAIWREGDPIAPEKCPSLLPVGATACTVARDYCSKRAPYVSALQSFKSGARPELANKELADAEPTEVTYWDEYAGVPQDSDENEEERTAMTAPGGGALCTKMFPPPIEDGNLMALIKETERILTAPPVTRLMIKSREAIEAKRLESVASALVPCGLQDGCDPDRQRDDDTACIGVGAGSPGDDDPMVSSPS